MSAIPDTPLPEPYSDELKEALRRRHAGSLVHQLIYAYLFDRRDDPPTDAEIAEFVFRKTGVRPSQLQRRRRQVAEVFEVVREPGHKYRLSGWNTTPRAISQTISQKVRFKVLQSGRCKACGRTVAEDDIKLVVDHVLPQAWGGTDSETNLQPLCEECNAGKKDYYGDFDEFAPLIRHAAAYDEPHRRIAMLFRAFQDKWIPSELLAAVASAKQYQEDWQKRARELRVLGIEYETRKRRQASGRVAVEWRLVRWAELPRVPLAAEIRRIEKLRKNREDNHAD